MWGKPAEFARYTGVVFVAPPLVDKARSKVSTSIQAEGPEAVQFAEDKMRVTVE